MLKSLMIAAVMSLAVAGTQSICGDPTSSNKVGCQSPFDVVSALTPIDRAVVVNTSVECTVLY